MNRNHIQSSKTKQWYNMDIHIHTPASLDHQQVDVKMLELLHKAEAKGLHIIAFTDHNTIAGFRKLKEEIEKLELLEKLGRIIPEEKQLLLEYRRLFNKLLILPGFEFTATFGFHIIGLFSPDKDIREIEHVLIDLGIPSPNLDDGNPAIGSSTDVITAYRKINEAGGIVIAAHANSSNGVAMRGMNFGGQTRIAYTQDKYLHALEVTDLDQKGPRSAAAFFNGTKPEYPRRMHCIQGSDSHRINIDVSRKKNLGIGDRTTEVLLSEPNFEGLLELFESNDFSRTRPHRQTQDPVFDFIQIAREDGANIIQDFHEYFTIRGGNLYAVLANICAFSNTNGGTLYIGMAADPKKPVVGIQNPEAAIKQLEKEIQNRLSPPIHPNLDIQKYDGKSVIRILIPRGEEAPYALDDNKIYIRDEDETNIAVRDEIVTLVLRRKQNVEKVEAIPTPASSVHHEVHKEMEETETVEPKTGVEVITPVIRGGKSFYTMRDLRNGNIVKNVTQASARRLWHYAISSYTTLSPSIDLADIKWIENYGLIKQYKQGNNAIFDFILKIENGYRFFFGVTMDGIHGPWKMFVDEEPNG